MGRIPVLAEILILAKLLFFSSVWSCVDNDTHNGNSIVDSRVEQDGQVLADGGVLPDGQPLVDGETPDPDAAPIGSKVLIYHGHGGVGPEGTSGYVIHETIKARYESAGLTVDYSNVWPSSMNGLRLIILVLPGFYDNDAVFSTSEAGDIQDVLGQGGNVVIIGDNHHVLDGYVINDLITALGGEMSLMDAVTGGLDPVEMTSITPHPLTSNVSSIGFYFGNAVEEGSATTCLAIHETNCIIAVEEVVSGYLVLLADSQIIDDKSLFVWDPIADNSRFADLLAGL